jgi:NAD(P)-dependent dehydrogenase (short-subunit alcohol dehydrogenase family)
LHEETRLGIMKIAGSIALVTGANRGLGRAFTRALVARGAQRVYAGARDPGSLPDRDVEPVRLDVTNPDDVTAAAAACGDVTLLINNAGITRGRSLLGAASLADARAEFDVNVFGTLAMVRAFAKVLATNGGGSVVNVLSVLSFMSMPAIGSYSASKAAAWSMTNGLRIELADQGTQVVAVHAGFIDTDMAARVPGPKIAPADVVAQALDAVETGAEEVLVDEMSRRAKAALPNDLELLYPDLRRQWVARRR